MCERIITEKSNAFVTALKLLGNTKVYTTSKTENVGADSVFLNQMYFESNEIAFTIMNNIVAVKAVLHKSNFT